MNMNSGHGIRRHRRAVDPFPPGFDDVDTDTNSGTLTPTTTTTRTTSISLTSPTSTSLLPHTSTSSSSSSTSSSSSSTSSSTSTTTSSSSSSSSSLTSTTPKSLPPTTPTTTTRVNTSTRAVPSVTLTSTSAANPSASPSSSTSSSTMSTGALVGSIAAGILGIAGVAFAIMYFMRRCKRDKDDSRFDSDVFKRQSAMLQDDEPPSRRYSGFNPRPPTMIQRHIDNAGPVSSTSTQHGYPYQQGDYSVQYNNSGYNSNGFEPGQVVAVPNPFHNSYGESPMASPAMVPAMVNPYDQDYNPHGDPARQPAYMSRQSSPAFSPPAGKNGNDDHYVNLNRSSVTPFQASQYEEISRQLEVPAPPFVPGPVASGGPYNNSPVAALLTPPSPARVASEPPSLPESLIPAKAPSSLARTAGAPAAPAPALVHDGGQRPDTVYTLFDDDDAYGGI